MHPKVDTLNLKINKIWEVVFSIKANILSEFYFD